MDKLTPENIKQFLVYNENNGEFHRIADCTGRITRYKAGSMSSNGYVRIIFNKKEYLAHRLAFMYVYGRNPSDRLDHINGIKTDNRISNLRECTRSQNSANSNLHSLNTSGLKGVTFHKKSKKWQSAVKIDGESIYLGLFVSKYDAHNAYEKKAKELFGEFYCNGIR